MWFVEALGWVVLSGVGLGIFLGCAIGISFAIARLFGATND